MNERSTIAPCAQHRKESNPLPALQGVFTTLAGPLQRAIGKEGYVTPTPIQEECIPHVLTGRDLLGTAQTGTGKTAAFVLPMLQRLMHSNRKAVRGMPRALVLAPTRELAAQISDSIRCYGRFTKLQHTVVFGGVSQFPQVKALNRGVDILVATPGRLLDLAEQGHLRLGKVEMLVLDEVDRMLDMGFIPDVKRITEMTMPQRQTLFFSATMAPKVEEIARAMVKDPVRISITPEKPAVERITQKVMFVGKQNKDALLVAVLRKTQSDKVLIFTQMKHVANRVAQTLADAGFRGTAIHGNKTQAARTRALDGFRNGRFKVLVATDVAARGLDVDNITHVINYDLPLDAETYVHRIGRTARAGAGGDAISFCCEEDRSCLRAIERLLSAAVPADSDHDYHCEKAVRSQMQMPQRGRGGASRPRRFNRGSSRPRFGRRSERTFKSHR